MKKTRKIVESGIMRAVLCVLCAICIIFSGCSGGTDDDTTGSDDSTTTSGENNGGSTSDNGDGTTETKLKLDLHCFTKLEDGTILFSGEDAYGTIEDAARVQCKYTEEARDYVADKFTKLQEKMQAENPTENTFKTVLNDAINLTDRQGNTYDTPYELADMLDRGIPVFYQETAKYIAQIINSLDKGDQAKFRACYDYLAAQAYERSLTVTKKSNPYGYPTLVTVNKDKPEIKAELSNLKIADQDVEKTLMTLLKQVAAKQSIMAETLKDSVNLALDIDGLYGLRDSVAIQGKVPAQTIDYYENWDEAMASLGGRNHRLPPRARYQYDPSLYGDYDTYPKPMFSDLLDAELQKLQTQTQSYEMGR